MSEDEQKTHFGYEEVSLTDKTKKVAEVFNSVADKYDVMNDLMSFGIHRLWKRFAIELAGLSQGQNVLDVASGTGDLTARMARLIGKTGSIVASDINPSMLRHAKQRLIDSGYVGNIHYVLANAENLPFCDNFFDRIIIGFGLRNVTQKTLALQSMYRVLKPGGRLIVLEFSHTTVPLLKSLYDMYSFTLLPTLGRLIAGDSESYRYLAESIRMHPDQISLQHMLQSAGFENCDYHNMSGGIVAVHRGYKS